TRRSPSSSVPLLRRDRDPPSFPTRRSSDLDAVFDSVSVGTTFKKELGGKGVIFYSFSDAVQEHPDLVRKYLGSVVPYTDNFYARSEEHTSELQSRVDLVCRLLLEQKTLAYV